MAIGVPSATAGPRRMGQETPDHKIALSLYVSFKRLLLVFVIGILSTMKGEMVGNVYL